MTYIQKRFAKKHTYRYFVDQNDGAAVCLCGKLRGSKKARPGKYNAQSTIYNGTLFDSKFEAQYAMQLDWRVKAGDIKGYDRQFSIPIYVNGEHMLTTRVDFRIHENDGSYTLAETKGFETRDFKIIKKLIEATWLKEHLDYSYVLVK
jgi:hypothetical protein